MSQLVLDNRIAPRKRSSSVGTLKQDYPVLVEFLSAPAPELVWEELYKTQKEIASKNYFIKYEETSFRIKLHDKVFTINHKLRSIYDEVLASHRYLEYKNDWDDDDAVGCDPQVYLWTIELLIKYAEHVLKYDDIVIKAPEINITKDGSFDLEWRCKSRMLLMNVVNSKKFDVHFYGKDVNSTVLKGFLDNFEINREVSHWMQKLV